MTVFAADIKFVCIFALQKNVTLLWLFAVTTIVWKTSTL